jgi:hypothetical protein
VSRGGTALLAVQLLTAPACRAQDGLRPLQPGGIHVLFIGNSLTYANDLPATVAAIAAAAGDTIRVMTIAAPNLALVDHLNGASNALDAIRLGGWRFVVMQQGPTSTGGACQDTLVLAAAAFAPHIRAAGAMPALYMVWPARDRLAFFDNVREAYRAAADAAGGVMLPAGEAWRAAWAADSSLPLYGPDAFHPSAVGSFLAALTIFERIAGRDARTLPAVAFAEGRPLTLPEAAVRLLQAAAHQANTAESPARRARPRDGRAATAGRC